jgi:hypothetical protein
MICYLTRAFSAHAVAGKPRAWRLPAFKTTMRISVLFMALLVASAGARAQGTAQAQISDNDDGLKIYAVNVVKKAPLKDEFVGYGVYLGGGKVLTAAHVVGNWPALTRPRVRVARLELRAEIVRQGSLDGTDLALLSIDETQLPVSLKLRRNPLCRIVPPPRAAVIVVYPDKTARSRVLPPFAIAPQYRARFGSLIEEPQGSGAGVFDAERRCLLGIVSRKIQKYNYRRQNGRWLASPAGWAGYYVPASAIAAFIPPDAR